MSKTSGTASLNGRDGVYTVLGEESLDISNRIVSSGKVTTGK
jgi:hypothetical protein